MRVSECSKVNAQGSRLASERERERERGKFEAADGDVNCEA